METQVFDLLVIGGGSGGLAMARRAAQYGVRVAVVESHRLGGTCVNVGCVPKKFMWNAALLAHAVEDAAYYGFQIETRGLDWATLKRRRDEYVRRLNAIYERHLGEAGIACFRDRARFVTPNAVIAGGRRIEAPHVVIATGGQAKVPEVPGAQWGITSDGYFDLERCPDHVALVGGGYIAVEFASTLHALGARVTIVTRRDGILRDFDPFVREHLTRRMLATGIEIIEQTTPTEVVRLGRRLILNAAGSRQIGEFDCVLWAIGREPTTGDLGLEATGVALGKSGEVLTDAFMNTNVPGLYAIGDVTGHIALTPVAIAEGRRLADRLFGGQPDRKLDYEFVPSVIFAHPPVGVVGLTEPEARRRHGDAVAVFTTDFVPMYYAPMTVKPRTAMKLVTVGAERRIVGCHIVGEGADEMLQGFAVTLRMGATKRDFDDTVAIHPTSAEEMVTMR